VSLPAYLANLALTKVCSPSEAVRLADGLHVVPDFTGISPVRSNAIARYADMISV